VSLSRKDALHNAWSLGLLEYKLSSRPLQVELYRLIRTAWSAGAAMYTLVCHRRYGKTWIELILALEECIRAPQTQVVYLTSTKEQATVIAVPLMEKLLDDCPKSLRPTYLKAQKAWRFKNGSWIRLFSSSKDAIDKGRGIGARLVIGDEARNLERLDEITATFQPAMDTTRGLFLLTSTPPDVEGHPFDRLWDLCIQGGVSRTIALKDNPDADEDTHRAAENYRRINGEAAYQREYQCVRATVDSALVVLPEFTQNRALVVRTSPPIEANADHIVGFDVGGRDFHALVFGTWDYVRECFAQQGEIFARGFTTPELVKRIREMELRLWGPAPAGRVLRYMDTNNVVLLTDLNRVHGLRFLATKKHDKPDWIRRLRAMFGNATYIVDPACTKSVQTFAEALWADTFKDFYRVEGRHSEAAATGIGHADLLDAALYAIRNIPRGVKRVPEPPPADIILGKVREMQKAALAPPMMTGTPPTENQKVFAQQLGKLLRLPQWKPPTRW